MLGTYHLNGLFDILKEIHLIYDPEKLWRYVLEESCRILQAEGGTFFVATHDASEMEVQAATGVNVDRLKHIPFKAGMGICGWVLQYQQPALVTDVDRDNRFHRGVDAITGVRTESILCVPVVGQTLPYGVIELINRKSGQFGPQDQEFMTVLGRQTAAAYQNILLLNEITRTKTLLESTLESMSGGFIAADLQGNLTVMNSAAARILHVPPAQAPGQSAALALKNHPWFVDTLKKTLQAKATVARQEVTLPLEGKDCRIGYTTILISDQKKNVLGTGIIFQVLST